MAVGQNYSSYDERPDRSRAISSGAMSGAAAGSAAGPYGAAIGAIIGAGLGLYQGRKQQEAFDRAQRRRRRRVNESIKREFGAQQQLDSMTYPTAQNRTPSNMNSSDYSSTVSEIGGMSGIIGENISSTPSSSGSF